MTNHGRHVAYRRFRPPRAILKDMSQEELKEVVEKVTAEKNLPPPTFGAGVSSLIRVLHRLSPTGVVE